MRETTRSLHSGSWSSMKVVAYRGRWCCSHSRWCGWPTGSSPANGRTEVKAAKLQWLWGFSEEKGMEGVVPK